MERLTRKHFRPGNTIKLIKESVLLKMYDKLYELEDAEEQGLLLRLPCEIEDKVFVIPSRVNYKLNVLNKHPELNRIYEQEVNSIQIYNNGSYLLTTCDGWCNVTSTTYRENWFLTKEEAEQALAKMKEV